MVLWRSYYNVLYSWLKEDFFRQMKQWLLDAVRVGKGGIEERWMIQCETEIVSSSVLLHGVDCGPK